MNTFDNTYGEFGYDITLVSGQEETDNDFANYRTASKSGIKYEDFNTDGIFNGSDAGLAGWTIAAFADNDDSGTLTAGDTLAATDVTVAGGGYSLTLDPGRYIVVEQVSDQPTTWRESPDADATLVNTFDNTYGEFGYDITLVSGQEETDNDFANYRTASKSGIKYEDANRDGVFNGSDAGLAGWTIAAFADNDDSGTLTAGDTLAASDVTVAGGGYSLLLDPGRYIVVEQVSDQPTTWRESPDADTTLVNSFDNTYGEFGYDITLVSGQEETDNDFANYQQATKSGIKYEDFNTDGIFNGSDAGLAGWTIAAFADNDDSGTLTAGDTLAASDVTVAGGGYSLLLDPGRYIVVEQVSDQLTTWRESPDADATLVNSFDNTYGEFGYDITLVSGQEETDNDFANYQQATKSGIKYEDFNTDGIFNGSDAGLAGWTIAAFADNDDSGTLTAGDTLADSGVTVAGGAYSLLLDPGRYIVVEQVSDQPATWRESPDVDATSVNTFDIAYGEFGYDITLVSGEEETDNDFANYQQASKSGIKYEDANRDGVFNGSDAGLAGWTIAAFADNDDSGTLTAGDTLAASDVTVAGGGYSLLLDPGRYIVVEQISDQPATWRESPDVDATSVNTFDIAYGEFGYDITLVSGEEETDNDFANYQQASKSGIKYEDANRDGVFNGSDAGLAGWTIAAFADNDDSGTLTAGDTLADSDVTVAGGAYSLFLDPGRYIVVEQVSDQPATWRESPDVDATSVNTFDIAYGEFGYDITLVSGEEETDNDFANYQQASKSGIKYEDANRDGVFNGSDAGLAGWTIAAFADNDDSGTLTAGDTLADSDVTVAGGGYSLLLDPGRYIVVEQISDQPATWRESPDVDATSVNTFDIAYGEFGYDITLVSGEEETDNDFANYQQASKSGIKYEDANRDGVFNGSDAGLAGWTIAAFADNDDSGTLTAGDTLADSDVTVAGGAYSLLLDPGRYIVVEQVSDQPATWRESPDVDATSVNTFDIAYGEFGYDITLVSGEEETDNDFANYQQASKSGIKYEDANRDGVFNGSDAGLAGWTIAAFADNDDSGTLTAGDTLTDSDVTVAGGGYSLLLDPGRYIVVEQISDQPATWRESPDADATSVNTFDNTYGEFGYDITLVSGQQDTDNDFANYQTATKSGTKFNDLNRDGVRDAGEPGLMDWEIRAYADLDGNGELDAADLTNGVIATDMTDVNGDYELTLDPGDYIVVEVLQQGWTQFHPADSVNVIDVTLGEFGHAITLVSGQLDEGNDFGNALDGGDVSILGLKFNDRDGNGEQDVDGADDIPGNADDEVGLEGWTIHLYENKNPPDKLLDQAEFNAGPLLTFVTDDRGIWGGFISDALLETLGVTLPLDLIVVEEQQNGWTQTPVDGPAKLSTGPEFLSSLVLSSGLNTGSITLGERGYAIEAIPGNSEVIDVDFGNRQPATKRGTKFDDENRNGVRDAGEPGLADWEIRALCRPGWEWATGCCRSCQRRDRQRSDRCQRRL